MSSAVTSVLLAVGAASAQEGPGPIWPPDKLDPLWRACDRGYVDFAASKAALREAFRRNIASFDGPRFEAYAGRGEDGRPDAFAAFGQFVWPALLPEDYRFRSSFMSCAVDLFDLDWALENDDGASAATAYHDWYYCLKSGWRELLPEPTARLLRCYGSLLGASAALPAPGSPIDALKTETRGAWRRLDDQAYLAAGYDREVLVYRLVDGPFLFDAWVLSRGGRVADHGFAVLRPLGGAGAEDEGCRLAAVSLLRGVAARLGAGAAAIDEAADALGRAVGDHSSKGNRQAVTLALADGRRLTGRPRSEPDAACAVALDYVTAARPVPDPPAFR